MPGAVAELEGQGAVSYDGIGGVEWLTPAGPARRFPSDVRNLGVTRDLLEWGVRRRVLADARIAVRAGVGVAGLELDPTGRRVAGVRLDADGERIDADLVVDASGRRTGSPTSASPGRARRWSTASSATPAGWCARPPGGPAAGSRSRCSAPRRRGRAAASSSPWTGGRWFVTLAGGGRDYPPGDEAGFRDFARSLADPRFAEAYEASEPLTPIITTRSTENRVRHYEELRSRPEGFVVTGDAACAFNPVYAQGMSAAAAGAELLGSCVAAGSGDGLARRFRRRLARANRRPWVVATGEDYRFPGTEGPSPGLAARLAQRYVERVLAAAATSPHVRRRLVEVTHLVRSPLALLSPRVAPRAALG